MKKNYTKKLIKLKLEGIGSEGDTTGYYNCEQINIFGGIQGETVLAEIDIQNNCEKCFLYIYWSTSLDVYSKSFNKYNDIINKNAHICH